jgi:hypothetical protein
MLQQLPSNHEGGDGVTLLIRLRMRHLAHAEWEFLTTEATAALARREAQVHHGAANLALAEAGQYQVSGCLLAGAASAAEGAAAEPRLSPPKGGGLAQLHSQTPNPIRYR